MRAVLIVVPLLLAATAHADDFCKQKGTPIDLDVKDADVQDVFRLLADSAHINLVVSDEVTGKVTLKLKHVAWPQVACTVAKLEHLALSFDRGVLLVTKR